MEYFLGDAGQQRGPFTIEQLRTMGVRRETLVWKEGMVQWQPAGQIPELHVLFTGPSPNLGPIPGPLPYGPGYMPPHYNPAESKRILAGVIALVPVLGTLGIHKFILGYTGAGLTYLLITLCTFGVGGVVMHALAIIEGIVYLSKSDEEFYRVYVAGRKPWF